MDLLVQLELKIYQRSCLLKMVDDLSNHPRNQSLALMTCIVKSVEENEKKLAGMTEEERDRARREIIEEFGVGIGDLLRKAQEARERRLAREEAKEVDKAEIIQKMDTDAHSEPEKSDTSSEGTDFYFFG